MDYLMIKLNLVGDFKTHKKGETSNDCQDASDVNEEIGRYAVADGATLSFFPKEWAELLVDRFCNKKEIDLSLEVENWEDWIQPIQKEWLKSVSKTVQESRAFMLVDRLSRLESALSTFIGIEFYRDEGEWKALIIGDSCLFHRSGSKSESYPLQKLEDFPHRPNSFASFPKDNPVGDQPEVISGKVCPGDIFILATDALSKWIIQHEEDDNFNNILERLKNIENDEQFEQFVHQARNEEVRLVNDDVTLMIISVEESELSKDTEETKSISSEDIQPISNKISFLFWLILVSVFGFVVGFIIFVLILLYKN